jgi:hypothetical protein
MVVDVKNEENGGGEGSRAIVLEEDQCQLNFWTIAQGKEKIG